MDCICRVLQSSNFALYSSFTGCRLGATINKNNYLKQYRDRVGNMNQQKRDSSKIKTGILHSRLSSSNCSSLEQSKVVQPLPPAHLLLQNGRVQAIPHNNLHSSNSYPSKDMDLHNSISSLKQRLKHMKERTLGLTKKSRGKQLRNKLGTASIDILRKEMSKPAIVSSKLPSKSVIFRTKAASEESKSILQGEHLLRALQHLQTQLELSEKDHEQTKRRYEILLQVSIVGCVGHVVTTLVILLKF